MTEPKWNGIPANPDQDGWHWIGYPQRMEPHYWFAAKFKRLGGVAYWKGTSPNDVATATGLPTPPFPLDLVEYLGPCVPPPGRDTAGFKIRQ